MIYIVLISDRLSFRERKFSAQLQTAFWCINISIITEGVVQVMAAILNHILNDQTPMDCLFIDN